MPIFRPRLVNVGGSSRILKLMGIAPVVIPNHRIAGVGQCAAALQG
jgi:hypothetical protein